MASRLCFFWSTGAEIFTNVKAQRSGHSFRLPRMQNKHSQQIQGNLNKNL